MRVGGQQFSQALLGRIHETVRAEPSISRLDLSRRVCEWLNWRSANGRLKDMNCRKALVKLERCGVLVLPKRETVYGFERRVSPVAPNIPELRGSIKELGPVTVYPVKNRYSKESKAWLGLLDRFHYLGSGPTCGAQIRYVVVSSHGYLGALAFSSPSWALKQRDSYIGWTEGARRAHLDQVICNTRFLILPTIHVPHLASHVLSIALSRVADDWESRYRIRPVLVETFVDPAFAGTCYRAANFTCVGESAGRRDGKTKKIFLYPLMPKWREVLCNEPEHSVVRPEDPRNWAEEEFGAVRLFDDRLKERLYTISQDFYNCPQAAIPEASGSKARTMGAYRFFENPKITMDMILSAHAETTVERIKTHRVVLLPQDTTSLTYTHHSCTSGLGPINNKENDAVGLLLHDTLAFTEDGTPLGVVDAQCWARGEKGKKYKRKRLPIEQKESMKWIRSFRKAAQIQTCCPETLLVSIGDRESDIYDLFLEATKAPTPALLVRADKSRKRKTDQGFLWDVMAKKEIAGALDVRIPRRGAEPARDVRLDLRFAEVVLRPPAGYEPLPAKIWAVYALNEEIEWMLLTTVPVLSFDDAVKRVEWYSARWGIEVYHRTLKSGCRIKDRQLETVGRLEACLGVDMVVAWRIYHLTMLGREIPDSPCTAFLKDVEWKALCCYVNKTPVVPDTPPSMRQAVFMIASMGGHLGRKGDGFPGTQTLWRGLERLSMATEMYAIFAPHFSPHPQQSGP
jgi:hypothetical protein